MITNFLLNQYYNWNYFEKWYHICTNEETNEFSPYLLLFITSVTYVPSESHFLNFINELSKKLRFKAKNNVFIFI